MVARVASDPHAGVEPGVPQRRVGRRRAQPHRGRTLRAFAWSTYVGDKESTRWRYNLEPIDAEAGDGTGTRLTERYEVRYVPRWIRLLWKLPGATAKSDRDSDWNVRTSLERIKAIAEG